MCAPRVTWYTRINMLTRVWQELEYRIDLCQHGMARHTRVNMLTRVCRVTCGTHIERL